MQQPQSTGPRTVAAPSFYLTARQPLGPGALLLAIVAAAGMLGLIAFAMAHSGHARFGSGGSDQMRSGAGASGAPAAGDDDEDDPSQIDTIVLGDPGEAPVPAHRGDHVSPVHPTIIVSLPRSGSGFGKIPDSAAGHLLYDWLAAFNHANPVELARALRTAAPESAVIAQMELRQQTGGFTLLSSKEVLPGVLVFRLLDQTAPTTEVLGTLQMRADSVPPEIASFSLRAVKPARAAEK